MLIPCHECGAQHSHQAYRCPHCAAPTERAARRWIIIKFLLAVVICIAAIWLGCRIYQARVEGMTDAMSGVRL